MRPLPLKQQKRQRTYLKFALNPLVINLGDLSSKAPDNVAMDIGIKGQSYHCHRAGFARQPASCPG